MSTQSQPYRTYTIKEVAELTGLAESNLRYYETIGLIPSIERDASSRYRIYNDKDVEFIVTTARLSATGMSIERMRQYLHNQERGAQAAPEQINLLDEQRALLHKEGDFMQLRKRYVDAEIDYWKAVETGDPEKIATTTILADVIADEMKLPKNIRNNG